MSIGYFPGNTKTETERKSCKFVNPKFYLIDNDIWRLDQLPTQILGLICSRLQKQDLLNLCLSNKALYEKCRGSFYTDLRITDMKVVEPDPDELVIQNHFMIFRDESLELDDWRVHRHETQVSNFKSFLRMLYNIFIHDQLGLGVKSIKIERKLKPSPFERCDLNRSLWDANLQNVLEPNELLVIKRLGIPPSTTLFQCLNMLISKCPNLERLWLPYFPVQNVKGLINFNFDNLKELKLMVYTNDATELLNFKGLKSLQKLRLLFQEDTESQLKALALGLSNSGVASQLIELQMKYDKTDFNYLTKPTWLSFFQNLTSPLINLKRLKLKHCFFDNKQHDIIPDLVNVIPFENIEWLSLQIYEYSHKGEECNNEFENTVLMNLSSYLKSLKGLWIKGSNDCSYCQFKSLIAALKEFHLDQLILFTNTSKEIQYYALLDMLASLDLKQLGFFDEFLSSHLVNWFKSHFQYETGAQFDTFKNYLVETRRQERNTVFNEYTMASFNDFNSKERNLLSSFWIKFLPQLGLVDIIKACDEVKLFGYNFKCDRGRKIIMMYISNDVGFVDLMYY